MDLPVVRIAVTPDAEVSSFPRKPASTRPGSSVSKYFSIAVSDQSERSYFHDVNKDVTGPAKIRTKKLQRNRLLSVCSSKVSSDSMASVRPPMMENTYKLKPNPGTEFRPSIVKRTVEDLLKAEMTDMTYDPNEAAEMTSELSDKVLSDIKKLGFKRHKFVVYVAMGNIRGQGLHVVSRALCDANNDSHVTVTYQTKEFYVVVIVHALYFE